MFSVPSYIACGENLGKISVNNKTDENLPLLLGFSLICCRILPNVCLSFYQAMVDMFLFLKSIHASQRHAVTKTCRQELNVNKLQIFNKP